VAKLDPALLVSAPDYGRVRRAYCRTVNDERFRRRVRLGSVGFLQFETREFALWHVHELLRVEGWTLPRALRTVDDVDSWCPGPDELVATVMLDTDDAAQVARVGRALLQRGAIRLCSGGVAIESEVVEPGCSADPIWYLRWRVDPRWHAALARGCTCATSWDGGLTTLRAATVAGLRNDLLEAPRPGAPLLHRLLHRTQQSPPAQRTGLEARP